MVETKHKNDTPSKTSANSSFDIKSPWFVLLLTLFGGIAFAFEFLLKARDYPELAAVMLGTIGLFIGLMSAGTAILVSKEILLALKDGTQGLDTKLQVGFFWLVAALATFFVLLMIVAAAFTLHFSFMGFGADLSALATEIRDSIKTKE